jgi:hypothetical protein
LYFCSSSFIFNTDTPPPEKTRNPSPITGTRLQAVPPTPPLQILRNRTRDRAGMSPLSVQPKNGKKSVPPLPLPHDAPVFFPSPRAHTRPFPNQAVRACPPKEARPDR